MVEDPEIIILDEATASLSYKSEMLIRNAIDEITKNKISFIIAHRLSTIKECSQILYLDKGKIIEQGTHKELIDKEGSYFKLLTEDSKVKQIINELENRKNSLKLKTIKYVFNIIDFGMSYYILL